MKSPSGEDFRPASGNGDGAGHPRKSVAAPEAPTRRKTPWPLLLLAILFVVVPFLAWYGTWFGRPLSDEKLAEYLADEKPRHAQHALAEIEKRITAGDPGVKRWYPQVVALAEHPETELRLTAAWVMGADTSSAEFRQALHELLADGEPIVRRNAALSLVSFGDAGGLAELRAMLRPHRVMAERGGTSFTALTEGSGVSRGSMLLRARGEDGKEFEVRSPLDGKIEQAHVKSGEQFIAGAELFTLTPDPVAAGNALIGMERFGGAEDLKEVERYASGLEGMPDYVRERARRAAEAIRRRS